MKITLPAMIIAFLLNLSPVFAQRLHLNVSAGLANYQGDLNDSRYAFKQSHGMFGLGLGYELSDRFVLRAAVSRATISAADRFSKYPLRNLNFTSNITEAHTALEFLLKDPYEHQITPYVFAGLAFFHYNPYTYDSAGRKAYLQPLSTEGQGFVTGKDVYKLNQFAIPFGGGLKFNLGENFSLGLELGLRKTFTDYLDDVSTNYVDENLLLINRGQLAVDLAYRGDEIKNGTYPVGGTGRGGAKYKDWYYFSNISASFRLGGNNGGNGRSKRGVGCPSSF